jgi:hypothetical protein
VILSVYISAGSGRFSSLRWRLNVSENSLEYVDADTDEPIEDEEDECEQVSHRASAR